MIPVEGLWKSIGMPGFISRDLATIRIDTFVFEKKPFLYRKTLAHEAAHAVLHRDFYSNFKYSSEEGWVQLIQSIEDKDFKFLEWQADSFAALVCVPKQALKREVQKYIQVATREGLDKLSPAFWEGVCKELAKLFEVQPAMIKRRIEADGLLPPAKPRKWEFGPPA